MGVSVLETTSSGFLVDDKLQLRVRITILKDEMLSLNSRKETGCAGLWRHEEGTCYINSLLQCLFHIPGFRKVGRALAARQADCIHYLMGGDQ